MTSESYPDLRVLIADDNQEMISFMSPLLEQQGVRVVGIASNGIQAVELFRKIRPDAVLMDINMPGLNGIDALIQIKDIDPSAVVFLITGAATHQRESEATRHGASRFLKKPIRTHEIVRLLREECLGPSLYSIKKETAASNQKIVSAPADLETGSSLQLAELDERLRDVTRQIDALETQRDLIRADIEKLRKTSK